MIKKCKWCGKEQEMSGKQQFCKGEKCKNAWKYAKRTGKLIKKEKINNNKQEEGESPNTVKTLIGILTKVSTTADQCLRAQVDIPIERVKFDTIQYLNQKIVIGFIDEETGKDEKEPEQKKDSHFDD